MEQLIKESEPEFRQHVVDKAAFKARLFQAFDGGDIPAKRRFFTWKKRLVLSALIVPMFGSAIAGAAVFEWTTTWNNRFHVTNGDAKDAAVFYVPPFWTTDYLNSLPRKSITVVDLHTSRTEADFPIREPQIVPGWNKVFSEGYVEAKTMPLKYLDIYQDADGKRVSILQQKSGNVNQLQIEIMPYPKIAEKLSDFRPDLAVFVSGVVADKNKTKANELDIYHKNSDSTVTEFRIAGTVSEQKLELFAKGYLQAPTN